MPFNFLDAIDGRALDEKYLSRYEKNEFIRNYGRPANNGEIGCYVSHYLAWEYCVKIDRPLVILEDDAFFSERFVDGLKFALKNIARHKFIRFQKRDKSSISYPVAKENSFSIVKYVKAPQCLLGYAIHPYTARALIQHGRKIEFPVDVFVRNFWLHRCPVYGLEPPTVNASIFESSIGKDGRSRGYEKPLSTRFIIIYRKLKAILLTGKTNIVHLISHLI